ALAPAPSRAFLLAWFPPMRRCFPHIGGQRKTPRNPGSRGVAFLSTAYPLNHEAGGSIHWSTFGSRENTTLWGGDPCPAPLGPIGPPFARNISPRLTNRQWLDRASPVGPQSDSGVPWLP